VRVADIFISYTSSDRDWAFWIAEELKKLDHTPHIHEWEIKGGDDIYAWMEARHDAADHVLCVVSEEYLKAPYSTSERNAALWQAASKRPGFVLFVVVKPSRLPTLSDHIRRCELFGIPQDAARLRFRDFITRRGAPDSAAFPGKVAAVSNIPIRVPTHFIGRDDALVAIEAALGRYEGRVAITALHGLRGVGKTTLAAAYAERHRGDYRATWWIRAQSEPTMRADLVALGVRLGWVGGDDKEEPALAAVMERLRHEGEGILLIFDNAIGADALKPYLPRGGSARVLVTSNAHAWRGVADPVEIRLWPKEIGADYLVARTGRDSERAAGEALSEALGGLPLAHEQAAAYCERLEIPLAEYRKRFEAAPTRMLDTERDAPAEYHDKLTVAKTFALAIEETAKLHPAAEPLIVHAALLASEPIPLFMFAEGRGKFGEPLVSMLAGDGLEEAVAALRAFALVDRETIIDERDPAITTDTIRLHRLVREVATARRAGGAREQARRALIDAIETVYYWSGDLDDPRNWTPRARRLDALALALVGGDTAIPEGAEKPAIRLMDRLAAYRHGALAAYTQARPLFERALAIREKTLGPEHPDTAQNLDNLARVLHHQGDLAGARPLYERALAIRERALGPDRRHTAWSLHNVAGLLLAQGDLAGARPLFERALAICEKVLGPDHPNTATCLSGLAFLLKAQGDLAAARPLFERALAIDEKALGSDHPDTAVRLSGLALVLQAQGDLAGARPLFERALAIDEKALGSDHPGTAIRLNNLASLFQAQGDLTAARPLFERALAIRQKALGPDHPDTASGLNNLAVLLFLQGDLAGARPLFERALAIFEKALGPDHPDTASGLYNLARVLRSQGDFTGARPLFERALAIREKVLGPDHPDTLTSAGALAGCLDSLGRLDEAAPLHRREVDLLERRMGVDHPDVLTACNNLAHSFRKAGRPDLAIPFARRVAETSERVLAHDPPRLLFRRGNLALTLLMTGETGEARRLLAGNWAWPAPDCANTTPGIAFLGLLADLLDAGAGAGAIGRLKTLLLGPKLPIAAGVAYPWDVGYLLDYLAPRLPDGHHAFLSALLAAINGPEQAAGLDRFPAWRDAEAVPRDTPWPGSAV
jgi:tetratricopeptide (TPR) repeat protein